MCHLILLMPVLTLPIFWLMPLDLSIPIYIVIVLISGLFYRLIARSMSRRPETGSESLIGAKAEVVSKLKPGGMAQYLVRSQGELWSASCPDVLSAGEMVNIAAVDGIRLVVHRKGKSAAPAKEVGGKSHEWHCH
jgi:membrane protein implicated in regulation of membrane protease activity